MPPTLTITTNVDSEIERALDIPIHPDGIVLVREHPEFPGYLTFDLADDDIRAEFYSMYKDWMSRWLILNELYMLAPFVKQLETDGFYPIFDESCKKILVDYQRWSKPLNIPGYNLYPYQSFSLHKALDRVGGSTTEDRQYFWNWSAGAGKSFVCAAGASKLVTDDKVDIVIAATLSKLKTNLSRFFTHAGLDVRVNDGDKKSRQRVYQTQTDGFVVNYERFNFDEEEITELVKGKRVLFILDECHKLISEAGHNKAREGFDRIAKTCEPIIWTMSATVVGGNPLRYRDVFSVGTTGRRNPLGTKKDFIDRYANSVKTIPARTRTGGAFMFTAYEWNLRSLQGVRHRVSERTMAARKTDPGIREQFKGITVVPVPVQAHPKARELMDVITDFARQARDREESLAPYYRLLRQVCITPAAIEMSDDPIAREIVTYLNDNGMMNSMAPSSKLTVLDEMLVGIAESGDQAVAFCHWTTTGIHLLAPLMNVKHVTHWGGQRNVEAQKAQDDFKADPEITCFLSSDAGAHGLNFQNARYVINIDPVYSYDDFTQRNARIDRADSHLDGLTAYVLVTEDSVEERVWGICNDRRELASAVQGTQEVFSTAEGDVSRAEAESLEFLVFGER